MEQEEVIEYDDEIDGDPGAQDADKAYEAEVAFPSKDPVKDVA